MATETGTMDGTTGRSIDFGTLAPGSATQYSALGWVERSAIRVSACIAVEVLDGNPTVVAQILHHNHEAGDPHNGGNGIDNGAVSPTSLEAMAASASAIIEDDIVANRVQLAVTVSGGTAKVSAVMATR